MQRVVREVAERGVAVCVVEHNIAFVRDLCDEGVFMFAGEIMARGTGRRADPRSATHRTLFRALSDAAGSEPERTIRSADGAQRHLALARRRRTARHLRAQRRRQDDAVALHRRRRASERREGRCRRHRHRRRDGLGERPPRHFAGAAGPQCLSQPVGRAEPAHRRPVCSIRDSSRRSTSSFRCSAERRLQRAGLDERRRAADAGARHGADDQAEMAAARRAVDRPCARDRAQRDAAACARSTSAWAWDW